MRFRIIGPGRAGGAFARALTKAGWEFDRSYGRHGDLLSAAAGIDVLMICVPDRAVRSVASAVAPGDAAVVHVAGSLGLDVLAGHKRIGSVHPLMTMPDADRGAARLLDNCHFAVAGDAVTTKIAEALGGKPFTVNDEQRALYHATAAVASNHTVALMAQVERLAAAAGVPAEAYWPLMSASMVNAAETGAGAALTGPAARADWDTLRSHRRALTQVSQQERTAKDEAAKDEGPEGETTDSEATDDVSLYLALAAAAAHLAGHELPEDLR